MLHSVLPLPKAGNDFTSRFQGCDWFSCRQDHWHSRTVDFVRHIIWAEEPAGTSMTLPCFAKVMGMPETDTNRISWQRRCAVLAHSKVAISREAQLIVAREASRSFNPLDNARLEWILRVLSRRFQIPRLILE